MPIPTFGGALGNASFQEQTSPDTTSAPPMQDPTLQQVQQSSPILKLVSKQQKPKKQRNPATLAAAIARARSGRPSARKWG